ncbi:MAG: CDP-diacylglycerol--glycerol-3-phosphate 3-phosphatidyltransferase [Bacteriovoracaceae bacterium]|nr:CDP-diacylglycerol--glycerol-3-phosphate 3-phosphatidyltransferase [Bacteriovoracaceae bacterium]
MTSEIESQNEWDIDNVPNRLTLFRVALVPLLMVCLGAGLFENTITDPLKQPLEWISAIIFIIASITDFFDGHIARKRKIVTVFGTFLDPIADKFLVVASLILLLGLGRIHTILVIILILREMYMTSLRLLATERGYKVPVSSIGKWKTAAQMASIPFLMIFDTVLGIPFPLVGKILIYIAAFLSLFSATIYTMSLANRFRQERKKMKMAKVVQN